MLKKRIIPCLDIKEGRTVKGVNFINLQDAGDPVSLAKFYCEQGADELVFLDINATIENRKVLLKLIKDIAQEINIPFTVGGGVKSVRDAEVLLNAGADKISINSGAILNPHVVTEMANQFGSQSIIVAMDVKRHSDMTWAVYRSGGRIQTKEKAREWAKKACDLGAGELLITTMDTDGTKAGFAYDIMSELNDLISIPIIASGGAGDINDFVELFLESDVSGGLAASVFHFNEVSIPELKNELLMNNIPVRL